MSGRTVRVFPLLGALQVLGDSVIQFVVANLRREQNRRAPAFLPDLEIEFFAADQRTLVGGAMGLDVALGRDREFAAFEPDRRAVGVEVDDQPARRGSPLRRCGRGGADEDDRFVRADEAQAVVDLRDGAVRVAQTAQLAQLQAMARLEGAKYRC